MTEREALELALEALEYPGPSWLEARQPAITAIKKALAQHSEPINKYCCHFCFNKSGQIFLDRMILCPECGNKRCPKATDHNLECTNSNYSNREWIGLTPKDLNAIYTGVRAVNHDVDFDVYGKAIEAELKKRNGYELN